MVGMCERQPPEYWPVSLVALYTSSAQLAGNPKYDLFERVRIVNHTSNIHHITVAANG